MAWFVNMADDDMRHSRRRQSQLFRLRAVDTLIFGSRGRKEASRKHLLVGSHGVVSSVLYSLVRANGRVPHTAGTLLHTVVFMNYIQLCVNVARSVLL